VNNDAITIGLITKTDTNPFFPKNEGGCHARRHGTWG
jgi:hypothetical protein